MTRRIWVDLNEAKALLKAKRSEAGTANGRQRRVIALVLQHSPSHSLNASEWQVLSMDHGLPRPTKCFACGRSVVNVARIAVRGRAEREIHLGLDCFDILERELMGLKPLDSVQRGSTQGFKRSIRLHYSALPGVVEEMSKPGASWGAWLLAEGKQRRAALPKLVLSGILQLDKTGIIANTTMFDACREYVNNHRIFDARVVLGPEYAKYGIASGMTPMTIAQAIALRSRSAPPPQGGATNSKRDEGPPPRQRDEMRRYRSLALSGHQLTGGGEHIRPFERRSNGGKKRLSCSWCGTGLSPEDWHNCSPMRGHVRCALGFLRGEECVSELSDAALKELALGVSDEELARVHEHAVSVASKRTRDDSARRMGFTS